MNKIIKNHGGLHNRVTQQIYLKPFNLMESEQLFAENGISLNRHQILESYMIFGGIPYYLSLFQKRFGLSQNVDNLCFKDKGKLTDEFENLYASLFKNYDKHIAIVKALSTKTKGLSRGEITETAKISDGGGLTRTLEELESSGFIRRYNSFEKREKNAIYQLVDFFTLFYFNFMYSKLENDSWFENIVQYNVIQTVTGLKAKCTRDSAPYIVSVEFDLRLDSDAADTKNYTISLDCEIQEGSGRTWQNPHSLIISRLTVRKFTQI
jgi:hypothetical protein